MLIITLFNLLALFTDFAGKENHFELRNGDLIFQESCSGTMGEAIKDVTSGVDDYNFTHVGIVYIDPADSTLVYVIEATHPKVCITPLDKFLVPPDKACCPRSVVGRLKQAFRPLIPQAIAEATKLVGKDYDDAFDLNNDQYYCSELIYDAFLKANDNVAVFPLNVMTFKSKDTGEYSPNWIEHFGHLGIAIPEGEWGINPGAMSKQTDILDIVHYY